MQPLNKLILDALVKLVRQVPWGPGREELQQEARRLSSEGSFEHGWDNYSTAARLWWESSLYKLAAEARFPREGDEQVSIMVDRLKHRLVELLKRERDDDDVAETTRVNRNGLTDALLPSLEGIGQEGVASLIDALAAEGHIEDPEGLKDRHINGYTDEEAGLSFGPSNW